ncbi:glycosyl hydrolase family 26, partial [Streptomyces griseus]|nr:glycosyl hydrolase family 26 [Streptomyces griseus]
SPTVEPSVAPSPAPPAPTEPAAGAATVREWCVPVPFGDWLGPWLREREICFRY